MSDRLRLMGVFAHPDDESLGTGGVLARYALEGVETYVVTATRGQKGRYKDNTNRPDEEVGRIRERELRSAAAVLGVREVTLLDYIDGELDRADPHEVIARIAAELRRLRPDVLMTFAPDGAYGHPDHIAISQFTTAATVAAAVPDASIEGEPHAVTKLYYIAWPEPKWNAYEAALKKLVSRVDGQEREVVPWRDWAITTVIDTSEHWPTVWRAVQCHESQMSIYSKLADLSPEHHRGLWGTQEFYRAFSRVNGGRSREADLFAGLRSPGVMR
ncbi:MAG TPA: PIG-L family deacetylase [Longimicrobiales bacterium]|nr:PIG-L family deacetylase [Longimicrobiales bacterium]